MIVLIGFMGAGKSTVGRLLASTVGLPFIDTDAEIAGRSGTSIPEIFATQGEPAFRALEREVVTDVLAGRDAVVSLGGGALEDPSARAALEWAKVVFLDVDFAVALARAGDTLERPMLARGDPKALYDTRKEIYARLADFSIDTTDRNPQEVAEDILAGLGLQTEGAPIRRLPVSLGERSYDVVVGRDLVPRAAELIPIPPTVEIVGVVTHPELRTIADAVAAALGARAQSWVFEVPSGEGSKSVAAAEALYGALADAGVHRGDLLVTVGGGVLCDLTGFVASTFNRGVAVAHVPTTLLAQVDAAIGGKTAVNLSAGKNLVGTFHQPLAVVCDVGVLESLPAAEFRSGLAEVVKHGLIADPGLLDLLQNRTTDILGRDLDLLEEVVARAAAIKARIVGADERERGVRAHLNYGHTFGHAIEHLHAGGMRHGEAVALGMMAAAYTASELGMLDEDGVATHRRALSAVGLPVTMELDIAALAPLWERDKKYSRGVRFVLLAGLGEPRAGMEVPLEILERALKRMQG